MTHKPLCNVYIASCSHDGGIYRYHLSKDEHLIFIDKIELDRPMYMEVHKGQFHVLLRAPFENSKESGLVSFDMASDGRLINKTELQSTKGEVACHLCVGDDVYCVNYISGSVIKMPDKLVVHTGNSVHSTRQTKPHTHQVIFTPDGNFLCVTDLGVDKVFIYDTNLNFISCAEVPQGHGARHMAFSPDGRYAFCANELTSTVTVFRYNNGKLEAEDTYNALPAEFQGESAIAAIRMSSDGKYLYTSNRGHDSISCFAVDGKRLTLFDVVSCGGKCPRDFNIMPNGDYLLCANENSDNVKIFVVTDGKLLPTDRKVEVKNPLCIIFSEEVS